VTGAAALVSLLLLAGCHKGNEVAPTLTPASVGPNPFPAGVPGTKLVFVRHPLTGFAGTAVVAAVKPPYVIGTANDGTGQLTVLDRTSIGLGSIYTPPRMAYGYAMADFNGDGVPDVISGVYSPTNVDSYTYLFEGSSTGVFSQNQGFGMNYANQAGGLGYRGRTETVVVADFNNDGAVDVFVPAYTYLDCAHDLSGQPAYCAAGLPPNANNALQSLLLLNDGTGNFREAAVPAGISMHSTLSGITAPTTDPQGNQPEGAQPVDFNMDGLIDLYVGGHLFINQGIDQDGVPHFKDMAREWGLTTDILKAGAPWLPNDILPDSFLVTDEGAKFIDWKNDGHLALLLLRWNRGPAHGARLFEFDGARFTERVWALSSKTATCQDPPTHQTSFFWSARPLVTSSITTGINAYDLDSDGLEDVLVSGDDTGSAIFYNYGCGFVEVSAGDLTQVPGGAAGMALADLQARGVIDVIYPGAAESAYFENQTQTGRGTFTVEVVGPNGEHNQYGRVIQVFPPGTSRIFTRVVDGGSGYLTQNQYPILVGTPFAGAHTVKVYFAPLTPCTYGGPPCKPAVLSFSIEPGQHAEAYAPSAANPIGTAVISPGAAAR
jgi:hypothetical protein